MVMWYAEYAWHKKADAVGRFACLLQPKGSYDLLNTWRPLNTGINIFESAVTNEETFTCTDSLLVYQCLAEFKEDL